jgi:(2Fe-2S) ferredoxin|nr:(2Fe-2S) ferredoxin domain-containing protein [Candidatus Krumholzibacteria bacterium]
MIKFPSPFGTALFVCTHKRPDGHPKPCCADRGGPALREELREMVKAEGLEMEVKVFASGCIGACERGPVALQYPKGDLMMGVTKEDLPAIFAELKNKG